MIGKKIALFAAAAALPLTALAATPASATEHHSSDPSIYIKQVSYHYDYFNVKVKYRCYSEDDDYGKVYVTVKQHDAYYESDYEDAYCDGDWHYEWVQADNEHGELESGYLRVSAEVKDYDDNYDHDRQTYKIRFNDHH
ncbi:MAG: hypothetical protein ACJ72G_10260 [Friedmanniella sp.]|jgi:hypothetical protein